MGEQHEKGLFQGCAKEEPSRSVSVVELAETQRSQASHVACNSGRRQLCCFFLQVNSLDDMQ